MPRRYITPKVFIKAWNTKLTVSQNIVRHRVQERIPQQTSNLRGWVLQYVELHGSVAENVHVVDHVSRGRQLRCSPVNQVDLTRKVTASVTVQFEETIPQLEVAQAGLSTKVTYNRLLCFAVQAAKESLYLHLVGYLGDRCTMDQIKSTKQLFQ
jgi:hypothetical protein